MEYITRTLDNLVHQTAFMNLTWGNYLMIVVALVFMYLAIAKEFEPLLLVPISFGMLLVNIYPDIMVAPSETANGGLLYYFFMLDEWAILPVRYLFRVFRRDRARIQRESCCRYFHYRRSGRPDFHFPLFQTGTD